MHDPAPDQQPNVQPQLNPDPAAVPPAQNLDPINQLMQMNAALMQQLQLQQQQMQQIQQFAQARGSHKVQAPDKFYGKPSEDVTQWSFELEQYFRMRDVHDNEDMVRYAVTLLRDDASRWYRRTQQRGQDFHLWDEFKTEIHNRFRPADSDQATRERLHNLRQGATTIDEYTNRFNALLFKLVVPLSGAEELAHLKRGLNKELRRNVEYQTPATAQDAQEIAARFARIDEAIEAGGDVRPNRTPAANTTPMDIDALVVNAMQRNGFSRGGYRTNAGDNRTNGRNNRDNRSGNRTRNNNNVRCFECGGRGHVAKDCANRKQRLSVNAVIDDNADGEDSGNDDDTQETVSDMDEHDDIPDDQDFS